MRAALEAEVQKQTAYLTRAIEALQAEIDERKRMETEVETHIELLDAFHRKKPTEMHGEKEMLPRIRF